MSAMANDVVLMTYERNRSASGGYSIDVPYGWPVVMSYGGLFVCLLLLLTLDFFCKGMFAGWATRNDIKSQLNMDFTTLLYKIGYSPEWDKEVFGKVMEQAENFRSGQACI